jgi:hypothetical protein
VRVRIKIVTRIRVCVCVCVYVYVKNPFHRLYTNVITATLLKITSNKQVVDFSLLISCRLVWLVGMNVSDERAGSLFMVELSILQP